MNKFSVLLSLTLLSTTTFAQIKFAPEAGLNMAMQYTKATNNDVGTIVTESSKLSPGLSTGVMIDWKIMKTMYLQAGVFYYFDNIKYTKSVDFSQYNWGSLNRVQYDRVHSLRLPVYLMYKSGFEGAGRFMAGIGPFAAYSLSGNRIIKQPDLIYDGTTGKVSGYTIRHSSTDLKIGDKAFTDQLRNWDLGLNACIGYESNVGIYFRGTFSYGLLNQEPANMDTYKIRNWGMGFSIGYLIGKDGW
jgi:hypothetical protein